MSETTIPTVHELAAIALAEPTPEPPGAPAAPDLPDGPETLSAFVSGGYLTDLESYLSATLPPPDKRSSAYDFHCQRVAALSFASRLNRRSDSDKPRRTYDEIERDYWEDLRQEKPAEWLEMQLATHEPALVEPLQHLRSAARPSAEAESGLAQWVAARDQAASVQRRFDLGLADRAAKKTAFKTRQEHLPTALELGQRAHRVATTVVAELESGEHSCQRTP